MFDPDYELFATVVSEGSLAAAGRLLGISPAMVSKRLARLEQRLGVRLVQRTTRRLSLTGAGETFHVDVVSILAAIERAEAKVAGQSSEVSGTLRLSAPTSFGRLHLVPHLGTFLSAHPKVDLRIDLTDAFVDMLEARIDLAIRIAPSVGPELDATRLGTSQRILCAAPDYLSGRGEPGSTGDLRYHRLLAADGQLPWRLDGPEGPSVVDGSSFVRTNSSEVVRELAVAGIGIALRSLWDVSRELAEGRLRRVLVPYEGSADVGIYAVRPVNSLPSTPVLAMTSFLTALFTWPPPWDRRETRDADGSCDRTAALAGRPTRSHSLPLPRPTK